jgi:hypothetical protein
MRSSWGAAALAAVLVLALGASADAEEPASVPPAEGSWKAETSAGLPVYFGVAGGRVLNTRFRFRWGFCGVFESHDPSANLEIDAAGHWQYDDPRGQTFEGTFVAPDRVEGKVISVERMLPGCPRTEATFTATPVPANPENPWVARAGVEELPYAIQLREMASVEGLLIGTVSGSRGESFRFFLFVNRKPPRQIKRLPGYAGAHGPSRAPNKGLEGGSLANTDWLLAPVAGREMTPAQRAERKEILAAVADTVCQRQSGAPCPKGGFSARGR